MVTKLGFAYKCRYLFFSRGGGPTDCPRDNCLSSEVVRGLYVFEFSKKEGGDGPPPPGPPSRSVDDLAMVKSKDLASAPLWHIVDTK